MTSTRRFTATAAALLLNAAAALPAGAQPAQLQPAGSEIVFTTRQMGVPVEGRFTRFSAQVTLDPKKPETGSVGLTIDTASARFGSAELDAELPRPTWLDAAKFPQATFRSTAVKAAGAGRYDVAGTLTVKGTSQDIVVPVQLAAGPGSGSSTASGAFTVKRLEFKVGQGEWADVSMVANDVHVRFKLVLAGLSAP